EADPRRGPAPHLLREVVVPPAAEDHVLRGVEGLADELERRARVVVEAADEPGSQLVMDAELVEAALDLLEVLTGPVAQVLRELRRPFDEVLPVLPLGVEDPERVRQHALAELGAERVPAREQV